MDDTIVIKNHQYRVAEVVADVSGPLQGKLNDWPANIQDGIYAALERKNARSRGEGAVFEIRDSMCDHDDGQWFVRVVAVAKRPMN